MLTLKDKQAAVRAKYFGPFLGIVDDQGKYKL